MNGNLIIEKINDPALRQEWHGYLSLLYASLKRLNVIRLNPAEDPSRMKYVEAVMEFIDARDKERTFFWDNFIRAGVQDKKFGQTENETAEKTG